MHIVLTTYKAAPPKKWRVGLNRYPSGIIGAGIQFGEKVLSLQWRRPKDKK